MSNFLGSLHYATPLSLSFNQNGFRMKVEYAGFDFLANGVVPYGIIEIIGTKAEGLEDLSGFTPNDFKYRGSSTYEFDNGGAFEFGTFADGYLLEDLYWYYNMDAADKMCDLTYVQQKYYVSTGNLYNIIYYVPAEHVDIDTPCLLERVNLMVPYSSFHPSVQTLTYGDFTFVLSQFAIQCGNERYIYYYRPGMSFSDWACSELNTDGWIPWYGDSVLSPDRAYICSTGYLDMQGTFDWNDRGNLIVAEEYDGKTNRLNNDYTVTEASGADFSGMDMSGATIISGDAVQQFLEQNGLAGMSTEEVNNFLSKANPEDLDMTGISPGNSAGSISADGDIFINETEEEEIAKLGNISVPVAHMVNAKTPLFTPGFRIVSKEDGRVAYHSVQMGDGLYLLDDTLDIYMNGIADELIPHIKLYAFPESEEFMATLEGHTILNAHTAPLEQGNEMLTIPEDAVCLTFQRVPNGQEAPNSPSPLIVPNDALHGNLNKDAVYARYVTKDDPNFGEGVNLVFAITFDDELVYWIHMGANFHETVEVTRASYEMPY